jgi:hypothetical protein
MINSFMSWLGSGIEQHTGLGVQLPTNSVEQPSVGVDFLGILLFEHQDNLDRYLNISYTPTPGGLQLTKLFGSPGCGWTS